jgi:hypothetical protein
VQHLHLLIVEVGYQYHVLVVNVVLETVIDARAFKLVVAQ